MEAIYEVDLRAVVRLLAEVAATDGDRAARRDGLLAGLADLAEADIWVWFHADRGDSHGGPEWGDCVCGTSAGALPQVDHRMRESLTGFARKALPAIGWGVVPSGVSGPAIFYCCDGGAGRRSGVVLRRSPERVPFSSRECDLARMVLEEIPWLHDADDDPSGEVEEGRLSRRQELTLGFLAEGLSRKEIADCMGVSVNTVAGYVRDVYRKLGVRSQPELMRKVAGVAQ